MNLFDYLFLLFIGIGVLFTTAYTTIPQFKSRMSPKTAKFTFWTIIALTCVFNLLGSTFNLHW